MSNMGCYGLRLAGVAGAAHLLQEAGPAWPLLTVEVSSQPADGTADDLESLGPDRARFHLPGGGEVRVDRATGRARLTFPTPEPVPHEHLVHPFLATACATVNRWAGRDAFHAGALVLGGRAWGILGDKGAGKSTLMAWMAARGLPVLADDLLVLDRDHVLAGPRSLDLRSDAGRHLQMGRDLGVVGARARNRVLLPQAASSVPLAGWVLPAWGEVVAVDRVQGVDVLRALHANQSLKVPPVQPAHLLAAAARPVLRFTRPQDWSCADEAGELLLRALEGLLD